MSVRSLGRKAKQETPNRGANLLFLVLAIVGCIHVLAMLTLEISRTVYTEREVGRLERDIAALELESSNLQSVIAHRNDAQWREQLARVQGFIYPDEARYVTVTPTPETVSESSDTP